MNKQALLKRINDIRNEHLIKRHEGDECDQLANEAVNDWLYILQEEIESGMFYTHQVREPVQWFAEQMEKRLKENDHKGGWGIDQCTMNFLSERMYEKSRKYFNLAGSGYSVYGFINQLADIANYAMMQADRLRQSVE